MTDRIFDQSERDEILNSNHPHYVISASAGSGKTTMLVDKAFSIIDRKIIKPFQQIAMITFTRLATRQVNEQIQKKMNESLITDKKKSNYYKHFRVSTTESFILSEIIKPFLREAYGADYPTGENLTQNYNETYKFKSFDQGLENIKTQLVIGSFKDNKINFVYQLGLNILKKSRNARKYMKARFPIIMVDEYQDVDNDMHELYMYLKDMLEIHLFLVGDIKQMLYTFRGADPLLIESLTEDNGFREYKLTHNFRSHMSIVDYSYNFFEKENLNISYKENRVQFYFSENINQNINKFISHSNSADDTFAYLFSNRPQWQREKDTFEKHDFVFIDNPPLDSGYPNYEVLEPVLKLYFNRGTYNIYSMLDEMVIEAKTSFVSKAYEIEETLYDDQEKVLKLVEEITDRTLLDEEKQKFIETLDEKYEVNFIIKKPKRVALTIHTSKGLEFDHVLINADSFFYSKKFLKQNHYVAITRPKESLHIISNTKYETILNEYGVSTELQLV
ncbi:UvrD-helicase domain-containing protein [Cerasibacillus terrae]|uniref:UvrD-helicase domain-containing protein n=1 Tax=Cerasibacillus terrae TaxID=2498845 RepID=UPI00174799D0|nr:UvrD-helicase domain-containing protein [Cerasibacillus terrae]